MQKALTDYKYVNNILNVFRAGCLFNFMKRVEIFYEELTVQDLLNDLGKLIHSIGFFDKA